MYVRSSAAYNAVEVVVADRTSGLGAKAWTVATRTAISKVWKEGIVDVWIVVVWFVGEMEETVR